MRRWSLLAVGSALVAACSFTSLDGVSGGGSDVPDAQAESGSTNDATGSEDVAPSDTGADTTVADSGPDGGPNLQPNGDFELFTGGSECGPQWGSFMSNATRVTDAHGGSYACQLCATSSNNYSLGNGDSALIDVVPGERYVVTAWVKAVGADAGGQTTRGSIRIYASASDMTIVQRADPAQIPLSTTWTQIQTILDITKAGRFNYYVQFNNGDATACGLVDDVEIHRF